ncbi:MAG TPA: TolC family protein [Planctomycetaceae bacterium]|nr:TolC family protein [Planctomycetaceae bacterium]
MPRRAGIRVLWLAPLLAISACAHEQVARTPFPVVERAPEPGLPISILPVSGLDTSGDAEPEESESEHTTPPPAAASALTLDDFERLALEHNPSLAQSAAVVHKAQGIRQQVGLLPNPTAGYTGQEIGADGTAGQQGAFVSQTIVTGDKLRLNRIAADQNINQLLWELEAQRHRVRNGVRMQFYETLGAQRRRELTRELVAIAGQGAAATRQLRDAQRVADLDVLQAEVQESSVRILAGNAEAEYEAAWRKLSALAGRPELEPAPLDGNLDRNAGSEAGEFDALWQELRAASPELQAAQARINRAFAQLQREQAQPVPNVEAQVSVAHDYSSGDEIAGVQIGLPLPIFNRNQGHIQAATAEYHRAVHEARRLELSLRNRLADAFQQYRQARRQVDIYQDEILPRAQKTLDLTARGYELGQLDLLRVLSARQTYFESSLAAIRAAVALRQAEVVLSGMLLTGGLNDVPDLPTDAGGAGNRGQALSGQ